MTATYDDMFGHIMLKNFSNLVHDFLQPTEKITSSFQTNYGTVIGTSLGKVGYFSIKTYEMQLEKQLPTSCPVIALGYDYGYVYAAQSNGQIIRLLNKFSETQVEEEMKNGEKLINFCMDQNSNRNKKLFCYALRTTSNQIFVRIIDKGTISLFSGATNLFCKGVNEILCMKWIGNTICIVGAHMENQICKDVIVFYYDYITKAKDFSDVQAYRGVNIEKQDLYCDILHFNERILNIIVGETKIQVDVIPGVNSESKKKFQSTTIQVGDSSVKIRAIGVLDGRMVGYVKVTSGQFGLKILTSQQEEEKKSLCQFDVGPGKVGVYGYNYEGDKISIVGERSLAIARLRKESDLFDLMVERGMYKEILYKIAEHKKNPSTSISFIDEIEKGQLQEYWDSFLLNLKEVTDDTLTVLEIHLRDNIIDQSDIVAILGETEDKASMNKYIRYFTKYCVKYYHQMKKGYDILNHAKMILKPTDTNVIITEEVYRSFICQHHIQHYKSGKQLTLKEYTEMLLEEIFKYNEILLYPGLPTSIQNEIGKATTTSKEFINDPNISYFQGFVVEFNISNGLYSVACEYALKTQNPETLLSVLNTIDSLQMDILRKIMPIFGNDFETVKMCLPQQETLKNMIVEFHIYQRLFKLFDRTMSTSMKSAMFESIGHQLGETKKGPQLLYASVCQRVGEMAQFSIDFIVEIMKKFWEENDSSVSFYENEMAVGIIQTIVDVLDMKNSAELIVRVFTEIMKMDDIGDIIVPIMLKRSSFKVQLFDVIPDTITMGDISESIKDMLCSLKFTNRTLSEILKIAKEETKTKFTKAGDMSGVTFNITSLCSKCNKPLNGPVKMFYCGHIYHDGCNKENGCVKCSMN